MEDPVLHTKFPWESVNESVYMCQSYYQQSSVVFFKTEYTRLKELKHTQRYKITTTWPAK